MLTSIQNSVLGSLPVRRKSGTSGWISFNAPCCPHNGESADARGRGGVLFNNNGSVSYHCFNCKFKASYTPGYHLNYKFRKLLSWLGVEEANIRKLVIDALRVKDLVSPETIKKDDTEIDFKPRPLPNDAVDLASSDDQLAKKYLLSRNIDTSIYEFYVSQETAHYMNRRLIIPFSWNNRLIGYTARSWDPNIKPKYYSNYDSNYVFNTDKQMKEWKFVVVCEGPFDAMSVNGVAVLGNECNETQADIIDSLGKEVVVVPDADPVGQKLIDHAIEYGWSVSFPFWLGECKDVNEAVIKFGKLFVLKTIFDAREHNRLKIKLMKKRLYN